MSRRTETGVAAVIFLIISLVAVSHQRAERVFGDGEQYHRMSWQFADRKAQVTAEGPFVYRLATPWLAARIDPLLAPIIPEALARAVEDAAGVKGVVPFYAINIVATLLALLLLLAYLRCFLASPGLRLLLVVLWMAAWQAPTRHLYFNPVTTEPLFLVALIAGLLIVERTRHWSAWHSAPAVAAAVVLATLTRESGLLIAVAFIVSRQPVTLSRQRCRPELVALVLPLLAGAAGLAFTHSVGVASNTYEVWSEPLAMIRSKPLYTWVLAWFFAFGPPVVAVILAAARPVRRFLADRPEMAVHLLLVGALAFVGGTDTERILGWAAPVVLVLLGRAIAEWPPTLRWTPALVVPMAVVQVASARVLWPVPVGVDQAARTADLDLSWHSLAAVLDKFLVIDNYYANLWSYFGSRPVHGLILAGDLVFVLAVIVMVNRR
ncbi:MAG: hypothetical protein EXQ50_11370 [Acidobacteria bacterium]|nr:hypothetical protein [Acidobacteriota bacterium]